MTIRNTTADFNTPGSPDPLLLLAVGMSEGSPGPFIEAQEKAGQQQLVHSDQLPVDLNGDSLDDFKALGFTFGDPDPSDQLFRPATLPDGWTKQASDHDMWSYILDPLGRRRVGVFYKAAFYDRKAHMNLHSVYGYLAECHYDGKPIVSDETWATPEAIVAAARKHMASAEETVELYTRPNVVARQAQYAAERVAEATATRDHFAALAEKFGSKDGAQ